MGKTKYRINGRATGSFISRTMGSAFMSTRKYVDTYNVKATINASNSIENNAKFAENLLNNFPPIIIYLNPIHCFQFYSSLNPIK